MKKGNLKRSFIVCMAMVTMVATPLSIVKAESPIESVREQVVSKNVTFVNGNSVWLYDDTNTDLYAQNFYSTSFDDKAFKSGKAPLGYPSSDMNSNFGAIEQGTLVQNQVKPNAYITYYFRNKFNISSTKDLTKLSAMIGFDDGFVLYLNGTEINRTYMNSGSVTHSTISNYTNEPSSSEGTVLLDLTAYKDLLVEGENVIAVSVHNRDNNSSDIFFDMSLTGTYETGEVTDPVVAGTTDYTITSPYETVDWDTYGQYKADFHAHSTNSDGNALLSDMVEDHFAKGFDILAMTDHNYLNVAWDKATNGAMTTERMNEIMTGATRNGQGMTQITYSDEQSKSDHVNTFFTNYNNTTGATLEGSIAKAQELGGISHINHPGRYTGAAGKYGDEGAVISNNPAVVQKYVDLFMKYSSCVGMEIINKKDGDSAADRILWDNILEQTIPQGRFVWGFSNDDTHSIAATGYSYNWMLMPKNTVDEVRKSMENGTFYAVAKVSVRELGANFVAVGEPPRISDIDVDQVEDSITIAGTDYTSIEWIADGKVIATGNTLDLNNYESQINSYVRAQLKGNGGIAFTQPFGVKEAEVVVVNATAKIRGTEIANLEKSKEVSYYVTFENVKNSNALQAGILYDQSVLEFVSAESLLGDTIFSSVEDLNGRASIIIGTGTPKNMISETPVAVFKFKIKDTINSNATELVLYKSECASLVDVGALDNQVIIATNSITTKLHSQSLASDVNKDGKYTLADLALALLKYQTADKDSDVNLDGVVDTMDYIILVGYISR